MRELFDNVSEDLEKLEKNNNNDKDSDSDKSEELTNEAEEEKVKEPNIEISKNIKFPDFDAKKSLIGIKDKIKQTEVFDPDMLKDMFFGTQGEENYVIDEKEKEEEENQPVLFDKKRRKRNSADPSQDKMFFSFDYMLTPDQALDGYSAFYNEFVKRKNIKWTVLFGFLAVIFLLSIVISPKGYLNYLLLIISLSVIAMKWLNSYNAKKDAALSADDVKNDSYKLSFYNSRIVIEASELAGDRIYNYPPVMIRFEDIDLKLIDYEDIYVLVFKKDYIYTVPKSAMNEKMNEIFKNHLENILGDDYREYFIKAKPENPEKELKKD